MEFKIKYNPELLTFLHNCLQKPEYAMVWYFDDGNIGIKGFPGSWNNQSI
jgi:hypothetical protein